MQIIVEGKAFKTVSPNEVIIDITFIKKENLYSNAIEKGTEMVNSFVENVILKNNLNKEDLKTRNFSVREEQKYDELTRQYINDGYSYNQNAYIKLPYDFEIVSNLLDTITMLDNPPICHMSFGISNEKEYQKELLINAYQDAKNKAEIIAFASDKTLKDCVKTDYKPFTNEYTTNKIALATFNNEDTYSSNSIMNTLTPDDIEINESLYCIWETE